MDGLWSSPDLAGLLRWAALNRGSLALSTGWFRRPAQVRRTIAHRLRRNTKRQSRRNIAAHYDLGNDFYRTFLDETMTYSSAVFATPGQPLADAQRNKYRLMAEGAGLVRGQHVLEIGTGWGGFALYAAGELGCRVTSMTISREQHDLARERVRAAGLEHLVDVQLRDYRDITGTYDAIVSIEMLEAVGAEYFERFFEICDAALVPGGRLSLQSITFPDAAYDRQLRGANWIQTYIFPGGLCPSLAVIEARDPQHRAPDRAGHRHRRRLRPDPAGLADSLHGPARRPSARWASTTVRPDVGVLPRLERGRFRDGHQPGPADRVHETARSEAARPGLTGTASRGYHRVRVAQPDPRSRPTAPARAAA